uniref:Uncharacterized protein n=1 Tax=Arundo donax TaxID=35708 RepID=A0A0A9CA55_ARUDO
MHEDRGEVPP